MPKEQELETFDNSYLVKTKKALDRLMENDDFLLILNTYTKKRVLDQVSLLGTSYGKQDHIRKEIFSSLVSISDFQEFLNMINNLGREDNGDEIEQ